MLGYETSRLIWWLLIGIVLVAFMVTDGFDMGVGCLLPLIARNNDECRVLINNVKAHRGGNQMRLILAGGALFAAWSWVYAAAFLGLYVTMILVLCVLFFRPSALNYCGKVANVSRCAIWDIGLVIGSLVPPVIFGIAFGNLFLGVPSVPMSQLHVQYLGTFWQLPSPFALPCGALSLILVILQGGVWLQSKTDGTLHQRTLSATRRSAMLAMLCFLLAGYWLWAGIDGYVLLNQDPSGPSNPLLEMVTALPGTQMTYLYQSPLLLIIPLLGMTLPMLATCVCGQRWAVWGLLCASLTQACVTFTAGITLFPFVMPLSAYPLFSLTVWNSTSNQMTFSIMLVIVLIFLPIVLLYTVWSYYKMLGRINVETIRRHNHEFCQGGPYDVASVLVCRHSADVRTLHTGADLAGVAAEIILRICYAF